VIVRRATLYGPRKYRSPLQKAILQDLRKPYSERAFSCNYDAASKPAFSNIVRDKPAVKAKGQDCDVIFLSKVLHGFCYALGSHLVEA